MESSNKEETNILSLYMRDAGQEKLLTPDEEKELFGLINKWASDKKNCSKLLESQAAAAREKLIKSNLKLVIKIAKEFRNIGLEYEDLINEGNMGLMNAIDKYDVNKGAKLSYYASFWIKQSIRRAISNKGRTIRIPVGVIESKLKVNNFEAAFELEHGRLPTVEEVSKGTGLKVKKINKINKISLQSESLNTEVGEENVEMGDLIINEKSPNPLVNYLKKNELEVLNMFLDGLDERQKYIIVHRFGLDGSEPHTLEVIGKKFNLTRERIRQLEIIALRSLREMYKNINESYEV